MDDKVHKPRLCHPHLVSRNTTQENPEADIGSNSAGMHPNRVFILSGVETF